MTSEIKIRETDIYIEFIGTDRLDLISNRIYTTPEYWWLILRANGYSIEFDIEEGELLRIPYPLRLALSDISGDK